MDSLGEKLKNLFKRDPPPDARFKGQGRKLGSAQPPPAPQPSARVRDDNVGSSEMAPTAAAPSGAPAAASPTPPPAQPPGAGLTVSRSHRTADVILDAAVMITTPTSREAHLVAGPCADASGPSEANCGRFVSTLSTPTHLEMRAGIGYPHRAPPADAAMADYNMPLASPQAYELQRCLGLILSWVPPPDTAAQEPLVAAQSSSSLAADGEGLQAGPKQCCQTLQRILRNALTKHEDKYKTIRLSNQRVQDNIVSVPGALEYLEAAGFNMAFDDSSSEGYLVLSGDAGATSRLAEASRLLDATMAAHGFHAQPQPPSQRATPARTQPAASAATPAAAAAHEVLPVAHIDRCTQVILPEAPDAEVPDYFFERTGVEVKAEWARARKQREADMQLATRAMREARQQDAGVDAASANVATVRVRFPEGVLLQGRFAAEEPASRVYEWVTSCLRSAALTYELVLPDRKLLATSAPPERRPGAAAVPLTVRRAGLLPSVLLNLRPVGSVAADHTTARLPLLSDAVLQTTRV